MGMNAGRGEEGRTVGRHKSEEVVGVGGGWVIRRMVLGLDQRMDER